MTEPTHASYVTEVRGDTPDQIRNDLNSAVDRAIGHAIKIGIHGVLVTQHSYTFYTVTLSDNVPYGQIEERRLTNVVTPSTTEAARRAIPNPRPGLTRCRGTNSNS